MTYAIVFSVLAIGVAFSACWAGSWWQVVLLLWAAASLGLVAVAYGVNAPTVFGKRPDGRIAWCPALILLPYRLLMHAVWLLSIRLSRAPAWQRIDERLIIGRRLLDHEVPAGIDAVLDLTCEFADEFPREPVASPCARGSPRIPRWCLSSGADAA